MHPARQVLAIALVVHLSTTPALADHTGRPYALRLFPNAIQDSHTRLRVELEGPPGERLQILILPGCGSRTQPMEPPGRSTCPSPLGGVRTVQVDQQGQAQVEIALDGRDGQSPLPVDVPLWLRVRAENPMANGFRQALFGITKDRCSLWRSVIDQFRGGRCVIGLESVFDPGRSSKEKRPAGTLEVRLIDPRRPTSLSRTIDNTQGATGAAWADAKTLLVTLGPQAAVPGLFRIALPSGVATLLRKPAERLLLTAPLPLPEGRIAVVEEQENTATLLVLRHGQLVQSIPLGGPVHQLLAFDSASQQLLGSRLFLGRVELFTVSLKDKGLRETQVGDGTMLQAMRRAPNDGLGVIEYEDIATDDGWELTVTDGNSKPLRELCSGPGHDLLPAWRPDGQELLFLGQTQSERELR